LSLRKEFATEAQREERENQKARKPEGEFTTETQREEGDDP